MYLYGVLGIVVQVFWLRCICNGVLGIVVYGCSVELYLYFKNVENGDYYFTRRYYTVDIVDITLHFTGHDLKEDPIFWADAFMLVFSLIDTGSYKTAQELVETLRMARDDDGVPILAAANKSDLVHLRTLNLAECENWFLEQHCLFCEVSASEDPDSIHKAFETLCKRVRAVHKKRDKLSWTLQRPAVAAKLQIRQSLKNLAEKKLWRSRTSTM
ncbi:Ras-like protein member 11B [Bulinus truncatus]|nr:Ras-like protein member 11B [Bulinus truncatus]